MLSPRQVATAGLSSPLSTRLVSVAGLWPAGDAPPPPPPPPSAERVYVPGLQVIRPRHHPQVSIPTADHLIREDDELLAVLMAFVQSGGLEH